MVRAICFLLDTSTYDHCSQRPLRPRYQDCHQAERQRRHDLQPRHCLCSLHNEHPHDDDAHNGLHFQDHFYHSRHDVDRTGRLLCERGRMGLERRCKSFSFISHFS